jgi:hypothetical protein
MFRRTSTMTENANENEKDAHAELAALVPVLEQLVQTLNKQMEWFGRQREQEDALRTAQTAREDEIRGQLLHRESQIRGEMQHREDQIRGQAQAREDQIRETIRADFKAVYELINERSVNERNGRAPHTLPAPAQSQLPAQSQPDKAVAGPDT